MKKITMLIIGMLIFLPYIALAVTVDGFAYLENQTNHDNIKVVFERTVPSSLIDSTFTDEIGYFSIDIESGVYNVTFAKNEYCPHFLYNQIIYSNTSLEDVILSSIINVPDDYTTIQEALNDAGVYNIDTVLVAAGYYTESIIWPSANGIKLIGIDQENCIIEADVSSVIKFTEDLNGIIDTTTLITGFTIQNGGSLNGGGISCYSSSPSLMNLIIQGNTAQNGSGIYCYNSNPFIKNVIIKENTGSIDIDSYGGGIYCEESSPSLCNVTISFNSVTYYGGGIYCFNSNPILDNVNIIENSATNPYNASGGGICLHGSNPSLFNVNINENYSYYTGGGICCSSSSPSLENVTIIGNSADYHGGGIYCYFSSPSIENVTISGNSSYNARGGGIYCEYSDPSLEIVEINNNTAYMNGAGIYCFDSSPCLLNVDITNNSVSGTSGGGICCHASNPSITNTLISGNSAPLGGGIYCGYSSSPILENVTINNNFATYSNGGGIYCYDNSNPSFSNITISGNSAGSSGGGIYCESSNPIFLNVVINNNSASNASGGGIYCYNNSCPSLVNVTISENSTSTGGGICCEDSSPSLVNVTITDNSASSSGGGIYCCNNSSPSLLNSIVSDNIGNYGIYVDSGDPSIEYSDFYNNENGNFYNCSTWIGINLTTNANGDSCDAYMNIQLEPMFVDLANGDYHLTEFSPCIDAGDPTSPLDPDGTIADMGAYYYDQIDYDITFNSLVDMNTARYGFAYANDGDCLYAICGGTYEPPFYRVNNIEKYNPTTNNWVEFVDGLIPRIYCTAEYIQSTNSIYIFGGQTYYVSNPATYTDTVEVVNVTNGDITYLTSNPNPYTNSGSAVWDNKIYIFGGSEHGVYLNTLYEFDPINNIWIQLPDMPESKQTEGEVVDGILYVFGGYNGSVSNRIDSYDIQNNEWSFIGYMPVGISAHHTTVKGQYIWIVGDYDILNYVAIFNTETHEFTQLNTNMIGRRHCGTEVIGNNLYVYGGNIASGGPALSSLQYADISYLSINDEPYGISSSITLFQNYPNPFNPKTTISFSIKQNCKIELEIFNIKGQKVKTLINDFKQPGNHTIFWYGDDAYGNKVSSGLYFYKLSVDGKTEVVKKCLLVK